MKVKFNKHNIFHKNKRQMISVLNLACIVLASKMKRFKPKWDN